MIQCKKCGIQIEVQNALEDSPFSWPQLQTIWHVCSNCEEGNHIRFVPGELQLIEIVGAPGPDWQIIERHPDPSVSLRIDTGCLHVWYKGKHYEVKVRE